MMCLTEEQSLLEKLEAIKMYDSNTKLKDISVKFGTSITSIINWAKKRADITQRLHVIQQQAINMTISNDNIGDQNNQMAPQKMKCVTITNQNGCDDNFTQTTPSAHMNQKIRKQVKLEGSNTEQKLYKDLEFRKAAPIKRQHEIDTPSANKGKKPKTSSNVEKSKVPRKDISKTPYNFDVPQNILLTHGQQKICLQNLEIKKATPIIRRQEIVIPEMIDVVNIQTNRTKQPKINHKEELERIARTTSDNLSTINMNKDAENVEIPPEIADIFKNYEEVVSIYNREYQIHKQLLIDDMEMKNLSMVETELLKNDLKKSTDFLHSSDFHKIEERLRGLQSIIFGDKDE